MSEQCQAIAEKSPSQESAGDLLPEDTRHFRDAAMVGIGESGLGKTRFFANSFEVLLEDGSDVRGITGTIHIGEIPKLHPPLA